MSDYSKIVHAFYQRTWSPMTSKGHLSYFEAVDSQKSTNILHMSLT